MSAERLPQRPVPLRLAGAEGEDAISVCLAGLARALRMPAGESEAIREELESHLHERVRDLEIAGMTEEDAVRCAAAELGDISHLAQRYREARAFPRRRLIMNLSMFAIAGAAVVVGVVTFSQPGDGSRVSVFSPSASPAPTAQERTALSRPVEVNFQEAPLGEVFAFVSQSIGMPVNVAWSAIPGISPDLRVSFVAKNADFPTILAEIGDDIGRDGGCTLAYRMSDGAIRVATDEYFDRREMVLASYDLSAFADNVSGEQVKELLHTFVYPTGWEVNGGALARASLVGTRMFVEAPKRYHVQIQWFIEELGKGAGAGHAAGEPAPRANDVAESNVARLR